MATKVHLGEVCLKPVFILKDLLKHVVFFQLGQGVGQRLEAQAVLQPAHPCQPAAAMCLGGGRGINWPLLLSRVVQGGLTMHLCPS